MPALAYPESQRPSAHNTSKGMSAIFRPITLMDLPASWQTPPDPEQISSRAASLGISPQNMTRRIVFIVPEHPVFFQYERFLQSLERDSERTIINCVIQNSEVWAQQSRPGARKRFMEAMKTNGAPSFEFLATAEYKTPITTANVNISSSTPE